MNWNSLQSVADRILSEEKTPLDAFKTLEDLDHYIDSRINKATGLTQGEGDDAIYAVIPSSTQGNLTVFEITSDEEGDTKTYATKKKGQITPDGDLISSPIIKGNVVVYGVMKDDNSTGGEIRELPSGNKVGQFGVSPPQPGFTYRKLMGGEEGTPDESLPIPGATPQQIPISTEPPLTPAVQQPTTPSVPGKTQQDIEQTAAAAAQKAAKAEVQIARQRRKEHEGNTKFAGPADDALKFD